MGENRNQAEGVETGGEPQSIGRCTRCGKIYPVQRESGEYRPIGTEGACECGNDEFEIPPDQ